MHVSGARRGRGPHRYGGRRFHGSDGERFHAVVPLLVTSERRLIGRDHPSAPTAPATGASRNGITERSARRMDAATKKKIIDDYATTPGDTGSPDVQIALLTKRIAHLTEHLKEHKGDHHSRRRLLNYVAKNDIGHYRKLIERLGLRR